MRNISEIRADTRHLVFISDGTSGSDKVMRLLDDIMPLVHEIERLHKKIEMEN